MEVYLSLGPLAFDPHPVWQTVLTRFGSSIKAARLSRGRRGLRIQMCVISKSKRLVTN